MRFLTEADGGPAPQLTQFIELAERDPSARVRLYLASALQHLPVEKREPLARGLLQHAEDSKDQYLPLMIWYGIEPVAASLADSAIRLAGASKIPLVRELLARRLGDARVEHPAGLEHLLTAAAQFKPEAQEDVLRGLIAAFQAHHKTEMPSSWEAFRQSAVNSQDRSLRKLMRELGAIFGDPWAKSELKAIALDTHAPAEERRAALRQTIEAGEPQLKALLLGLLGERAVAGVAARGLLIFNDPEIPEAVLKHWDLLEPEDRVAVVGALTSRATYAMKLLDAIGAGQLPRTVINAFQARQIRNFNNPELNQKLDRVWGEVRAASADKTQLMARYRQMLTPEKLKEANLSRGREVFTQVCALCHKLYGQGAGIGPDLTGGGRANLDYLLENILDPSAIVPADYRVSDMELKDDRSYTALIVAKTENSLTLQTPTERLTVERNEIAENSGNHVLTDAGRIASRHDRRAGRKPNRLPHGSQPGAASGWAAK